MVALLSPQRPSLEIILHMVLRKHRSVVRLARVLLLLAIGWLLWPHPASAQEQPQDSLLAQMRDAFQQLDYTKVQDRAAALLVMSENLTSEQLILVHTMLGVVDYSTGDEAEARRQFEAALAIAPDLTLDPSQYSPKILTFFEEIKADHNPPPAPVDSSGPRYILLRDPVPAAAARSIILPGWGQIYKGQRAKGGILIGLWGMTASGLIASEIVYGHYSRAYDKALTQQDATRLFNRRNTWFMVRNVVGLGAAGIWVYSYLDTILSHAPPIATELSPQASLTIRPGPSSLSLALRF